LARRSFDRFEEVSEHDAFSRDDQHIGRRAGHKLLSDLAGHACGIDDDAR
jgi:hypothetical protein